MDERQEYIPSILFALLVAIFPHVTDLPLWVIAWCAFMWAYALVCMKYNRPVPSRLLRNVLTVVGIIGLLLTFRTRIDASAYISLLVIMAAIKPLEISTHRDGMVTVFLAYFIVITSLLKSETLLMTVYMFISVLVTTAVLVRINDPGGRFRDHFRLSAVMLAQAVPLMLALFFLFPRLEGSLVGISRSETGVTGFSETLRPGGVSRLVEDDTVAFRVEFDDDIPDFEHLYWRGIVFVHFDGTAWRQQRQLSEAAPPEREKKDATGYSVILEPHRSRWLFAMDFPEQIPEDGRMYEDFTVLSRKPVYRTKRYAMVSDKRDHTGKTDFPADAYTRLAGAGNPESRALGARLAENAAGAEEIVRNALDYFRERGFVYTVTPPLAGRNPVDDFLFDAQSGYCEHYASAFAFLMRSAGIPARVVGGYLGGEINPYGNYLIVRQSYAHAWVEVWNEEKGWFRVDPTAVVAPGRIAGGPEGGLSPGELRRFADQYLQPFSAFIQQARFGWDAFSKNWQAWFEGYSFEQQKALLERLGITDAYRTGPLVLLLAGFFLVFLFFAVYLFIQLHGKTERPDDVKKRYRQFLQKMSGAGVEKHPGEGPGEFAEKAAAARPDLASAIGEITALYIVLRYSPLPPDDAYFRFEKAVKGFAPPKQP
ncbi:MAG: DUF3488 and transglutaminase-like domain-containing protein [Desulfosalsimonadaceae bacterium]